MQYYISSKQLFNVFLYSDSVTNETSSDISTFSYLCDYLDIPWYSLKSGAPHLFWLKTANNTDYWMHFKLWIFQVFHATFELIEPPCYFKDNS